MIAVVDVVGNNFNSLMNAIDRLGFDAKLTHAKSDIVAASHVILPGVGTAPHAMQALEAEGLISLIQQLKQPLLGICLGMQILFDYCEEGHVAGLGIIRGKVRSLSKQFGFPVPHMGWNRLHWTNPSKLQLGISDGAHVYFVHSFAVDLTDDTTAKSHHSIAFSAMVQKNNTYGMQFHPEKSAEIGQQLLKNFLTLEPL